MRLAIEGKRAAMGAGFDPRSAGQLAAAILELADNIVQHSDTPEPGLIAFEGADGAFEFVAADTGIGALASLRSNSRYRHLGSEREALPLILQDGCSRSDDVGRGKGFSDLFRGLANHQGRLRFRSGDAAVLIDGQSPGAIAPKIKAKPRLAGFMAAVHCVA